MLLRSLLSRARKHPNYSAGSCSLHITEPPSNANPVIAHSHSSTNDEKTREKAFVLSYLINSCGLSPESAVSASKKVHFDSRDKPDSVVDFLEKKLGFSKSQIATLVRKRPRILVANIEKTLSPKIDFYLNNIGFRESDVCKLVSMHPTFLVRNMENSIGPAYDYLKDLIGAEKADSVLKRGSWILIHDLEKKLIPNVEFLRQLGLPQRFIDYGLTYRPDVFCLKPDKLKELVEEVKGMGFDLSKVAFVEALSARTGANRGLWDRSYQVYRKWGLSEDDIRKAYMKHPGSMLISEKKISAVLDLVVNKMGREVRVVVQCPTVVSYSMENRLLPRCSVVRSLLSEGLANESWGLGSVFNPSEKDFLLRYVERHAKKLPQLYDVYKSSKERGVLA